MSEGYAIVLVILFCLIFGKLSGIRTQLSRIADFCERSEKRMRESV